MAAATPMFIADAALGRLATWLRLLGCDVVYARGAGEAELRRRALPPHLLVQSDDFRAQLRQVVETCGLRAAPAFLARCVRCNTPIEDIDRTAACAQVPAYVCETQSAFARCPSCGRIYWPATHVARMRGELARIGLSGD